MEARQKQLYELWLSQRPEGGGAPARSAFDPVDAPKAMSTLIFAEVEPDDYFFRVVGTDMVEAWGRDYTGERLSDIMTGDYHAFIRSLFDQCVRTQACVFSHSRFQWDRGRTLDTRRLMLPFARDEDPGVVGFVLVSQVFDYSQSGPVQPIIAEVGEAVRTEIAREVLGAG
ncbi:MAG: PAS domain-containing protein [Marivibrio sp.]|uniref:PAS domain-containing protein n=1 Tax=Marivibrio sp. TaxID=2039719 RepID=UPI0032EFF8E8